MRTVKIVILVSALLGSVPLAQSQQTTLIQRDGEALAFLSKCSSQMGAVRPSDDWIARGQITVAQRPEEMGSIEVRSRGTAWSKEKISLPRNEVTYFITPSDAKTSSDGKTESISDFTTKYHRQDYVPALACSAETIPPRANVIYLGLETIEGHTAHHIKIFVPALDSLHGSDEFEPVISEFHVYLDSQTFLVTKTGRFVFSPTGVLNRSEWETVYSSYRDVNGTLMPFHVELYLAGEKLWIVQLNDVQKNTGLSDSEFSVEN